MIQGYRSITDLDALHLDQHRLLFQNCLGVIEKVFTTVPTSKELPNGYCGIYISGTTKRLYFNINGTITYFVDSVGVTTEVSAVFPSGGIIMWSGTVATIPSGWYLCNGSNGTPDLRNRFIVGVDADDGGVAKSTVTGSALQSSDGQIPSHSHAQGTLVTSSSDPHVHPITYLSAGSGASPTANSSTGGGAQDTGSAGSHAHTISGSTDAIGTGTKNIAVFYALAFIMKA